MVGIGGKKSLTRRQKNFHNKFVGNKPFNQKEEK